MKKELKMLWILVVTMILAACSTDNILDNTPGELRPAKLLAVRSAETLGVSYRITHVPDAALQGPQGIYKLHDGLALIDNVGKRLLVLDPNFNTGSVLEFGDVAQSISDLVEYDDELIALDAHASRPELLRFEDGKLVSWLEIPLDGGMPPTGIARDDTGIVFEYENGIRTRRLTEDGTFSDGVQNEYVFNGVRYALDSADISNPHERMLQVNGAFVILQTPNYLGTARILDGSENGVTVLVEDVTFGEVIQVTQSVWDITPNATIRSVSSVPQVEKDEIYVPQSVAAFNDGDALVLKVKSNVLQFWQTQPSDPEIVLDQLPRAIGEDENKPEDGLGTSTQALTTYNGSCLSQSQMTGNANEYLNTSVYMTSTNINNPASCGTRYKPGYLGSPGTYYSVSYDWGGWDTPSQFSSAMAGGGKAGNLYTGGSGLSCTYGVDCSGFVTRVWGFTDYKRSTTGLLNSNTSTAAYGPGYYIGDAFVKSGVHVVLYVSTGGNGFNLWESAGEPYARVVSRNSAWSYVSGYTARHSITHCGY